MTNPLCEWSVSCDPHSCLKIAPKFNFENIMLKACRKVPAKFGFKIQLVFSYGGENKH